MSHYAVEVFRLDASGACVGTKMFCQYDTYPTHSFWTGTHLRSLAHITAPYLDTHETVFFGHRHIGTVRRKCESFQRLSFRNQSTMLTCREIP